MASSQLPPSPAFCSRLILFNYASPLVSSAYKHDDFSSYNMKRCCFSSHAMVENVESGLVDVPLAQTGEGIAECELLRWFVQEGDQVEDFQPLCEVQSDKATIEITSRYKGKVFQILYSPGDIVKVGETLLKMFVGETQPPKLTCDNFEGIEIGSETLEPSSQCSLMDKINIAGALSTPAVRNLAKQYGINVNDVTGSGKDGRILKEDILQYASQKGKLNGPSSLSTNSAENLLAAQKYPYTPATDGSHYEDKTIPLRGFQRAMVKSMAMAARVPHFHYVEEINCNSLVELKSCFQKEKTDPDVKYTFLPLLIKSLSMALTKHPLVNSCFNEDSHEVILKGSHNIGVAMATPYGLVVPNIKKVQSLSIFEITKELSRLQHLAINNKLSPEDITGGTITLSNIGAVGGKFGSPLLNLPEVSIIAIGRIQKVPRFSDDGDIYPVSIMTVNVGADHRVLDGATIAKFCNEWKLYIEKPELLTLHMR